MSKEHTAEQQKGEEEGPDDVEGLGAEEGKRRPAMNDLAAGAWLGGTLDTSASVVAAGALISDAARRPASSSSSRRTR